MPKYMLLAYEAPEHFARRTDTAQFDAYMGGWMAFSQAMNDVTASGKALQGPETATTVTVKDGKRTVQDGPYPDTKEQLGGFFIVDVPDIQTAIDWAARCPAARGGRVDVRRVMEID